MGVTEILEDNLRTTGRPAERSKRAVGASSATVGAGLGATGDQDVEPSPHRCLQEGRPDGREAAELGQVGEPRRPQRELRMLTAVKVTTGRRGAVTALRGRMFPFPSRSPGRRIDWCVPMASVCSLILSTPGFGTRLVEQRIGAGQQLGSG